MSSGVQGVRYVCLSDLHLGEPDSILTPLMPTSHAVDPRGAGPVLEQLVLCLEQVVARNSGDRRPILILNGDVLELAFGTFDQALTNFERLVGLLLERELFEKLVYIPGNHDHHIWEVARETQYGNTLAGRSANDGGLPPLRHVTSLHLEEAVPAFLLNKIIEGVHPPHGPDEEGHEVLVVYPNLALLDESGNRCVLFHHGHYVEPLYHFFSKLRRWLFPDRPQAQSIDEIEEENFAWIEFVWSLLGRSGGAGADMRLLYRMFRTPDEYELFADELAKRSVAVIDLPWIPGDKLERLALKKLFTWVGPKLSGERSKRRVVESPELRSGIEAYLFGPAYRQLRDELGRVPDDLTFVFGHTHKPFEGVLDDPSGKGRVEVFNTGGWPIDSIEPSDAMGASILFLNQQLDVACLRIFNDGGEGGEVTLDVCRPEGARDGDEFRASLEACVTGAAAEPWKELEARIHDAIARRRRDLQEEPH
ncbi:MAG: metallophosphoesterase [Gemmatimonadota bacterium]|nr:MAG: metallophosphoesterase [Gemmatimonadota bacterium]